jgi:hypothetical protein
LDVLGLLFFAAAWALLLIPLTIVNNATSSWHSPRIIAMITLGCVGLVGFGWYEVKWAKVPIIPTRFLRNKYDSWDVYWGSDADVHNRTVLAVWAINFFDFVSFYLQFVSAIFTTLAADADAA